VVPTGEGGLTGLEIDRQGRVFVMYTSASDNRIVRLEPDGSQKVLVSGIAKAAIHDAGRLRFGPDGTLYASTGDAGRPDLHAGGTHTVDEMARALYRSITERLLTLPDHLVLYPAHYSGSVCGRGLSANPASTVGFERRHNKALAFDSEDAFAEALVRDIPTAPGQQAAIVAANRAGRPLTRTA